MTDETQQPLAPGNPPATPSPSTPPGSAPEASPAGPITPADQPGAQNPTPGSSPENPSPSEPVSPTAQTADRPVEPSKMSANVGSPVLPVDTAEKTPELAPIDEPGAEPTPAIANPDPPKIEPEAERDHEYAYLHQFVDVVAGPFTGLFASFDQILDVDDKGLPTQILVRNRDHGTTGDLAVDRAVVNFSDVRPSARTGGR